ncbi:MAG: diaminopimelate dehydrogenase [Clostridia bacterium]|nr:diaminopimelate dehydrogenase [Clostridia bacterium]
MKLGIYGYGNLGRGAEAAVRQNGDAELVGIFTRRSPDQVKSEPGTPVFRAEDVFSYEKEIDVLLLCGGSATDLPVLSPLLAERFNLVDSFDTHAKIPEHFDKVDAAARRGGKTALISGGWDPGLFSLARLYAGAVLPRGDDFTFWGRGVSQGHSDAIRRIPGVLDARQYTVPVPEAVRAAENGESPSLSPRQTHRRECFVAVKEGADREAIREAIVTMPHYFAGYDTSVTFVSAEKLKEKHAGLPHGGRVIRRGRTGPREENRSLFEFSLKLDSNPEFTGLVLVALARAVDRMHRRGSYGCHTVFDVAPADLSPLSARELRRRFL